MLKVNFPLHSSQCSNTVLTNRYIVLKIKLEMSLICSFWLLSNVRSLNPYPAALLVFLHGLRELELQMQGVNEQN